MENSFEVLGKGYVKLIEHWGSDERIIEAARMSTSKGFNGWGEPCKNCEGKGNYYIELVLTHCKECDGQGHITGDEKLLKFLYTNNHSTPFEMAGLIIEVKAPIFVFREWHRHRTQSYNEMSARYIPLPNENYTPTLTRLILGSKFTANKQATGTAEINIAKADLWLSELAALYAYAQEVYEKGLEAGVPKELARLSVPVARFSRMRASANLLNWLKFLTLRMDSKAQWEIREYAKAVGNLISQKFPKTWELFVEHTLRSEQQ